MRTWHGRQYCSLLYVGCRTSIGSLYGFFFQLVPPLSFSTRSSFSLIVHWDMSVLTIGRLYQRHLFIYSVHWPGVKEMSFLFPQTQRGSVQTVPALAAIQPKNNQERKNHLPHPLHTSPFLSSPQTHCHFSSLKWQTIWRKTTEPNYREKQSILHQEEQLGGSVWYKERCNE